MKRAAFMLSLFLLSGNALADCEKPETRAAVSNLSGVVIAMLVLERDYDQTLARFAKSIGADGLEIINCSVKAHLEKPIPKNAYAGFDRHRAAEWLSKHSNFKIPPARRASDSSSGKAAKR